LIASEAEKIARLVINRSGAQMIDPEIEQREIAQDAVKKLRREGPIWSVEFGLAEQLLEDRIGETITAPPLRQSRKSKLPRGGLHEALEIRK
jgi:hypothetical protein